ncbi:MAG TPA: ferredoxin [Dehalococcoidia bacterium]|nr:ferredoxin [Dehalococcoidia bacterium]
MKVRVDEMQCEGHGKCELAAPEVFELGDDDVSRVLIDDVPPELKEKVDRAIRLCPRQAIAWVDESTQA